MGIIPQHAELFTGSVADNLRVGNPDATDADLEAAARTAQAHEFIADLPHGYPAPPGLRPRVFGGITPASRSPRPVGLVTAFTGARPG